MNEITKRYSCEETTVDLRYQGIRVRLWLDNPNAMHDGLSMAHHAAKIVMRLLRKADDAGIAFSSRTFAEHLAADPELSVPLAAVQVIEPRGAFDFGHMIYTKPFSD